MGGLPFEVAEFDLPEGSVLAFYADGLLEGADRDAEAEREVSMRCSRRRNTPLEDACDTLLERLSLERRTDDAALLLARTKALGSDRVASSQPAALRPCRRCASG